MQKYSDGSWIELLVLWYIAISGIVNSIAHCISCLCSHELLWIGKTQSLATPNFKTKPILQMLY